MHNFYDRDYVFKLLSLLNLQFLKVLKVLTPLTRVLTPQKLSKLSKIFLLFVVVMPIGRISFYIHVSLSGHVTLFLVRLFLRQLHC